MARTGGSGRWSGLLRMLAYVAYPALAGAACAVLCLGVITWLPALAATAHTLQRWRRDDDARCFTGVFTAFRDYWRPLLGHGALSTVVLAVLAANTLFLFSRPEQVSFVLLAAQLGVGAVFVIYHISLAVVAGAGGAGLRQWGPAALAFGFGSPVRGTALLGAAIATPVFSLIIPLGPVLLGPSIPLLVGLAIADRPAQRGKPINGRVRSARPA